MKRVAWLERVVAQLNNRIVKLEKMREIFSLEKSTQTLTPSFQ